MFNSEVLEIILPALVASLMIALTHAPLGIEVLGRGTIFIDLAIAQIAGLGVVVASAIFEETPWWITQFAALFFALLAAFTFRWVERRLPRQQEAIIGCSFVVSASLALLLLADRPHGGEEIERLLSGQILFVTWRDILVHTPIYAAILALWFAWPQIMRKSIWFYVLFAVAVTSSVQIVGVYVVFASLILPALAAGSAAHPLWSAWCCGLISVFLGVFVSTLIDAPAGPVLVLAYAIVALAVVASRRLAANPEG